MLFFISFALSKAMHKPYITTRLLLPFYPLVVMALIEVLQYLSSKFNIRASILKGSSMVLFLLLFGNHLSSFDLQNNPFTFQKSIFKDLDLNVTFDVGCCSSIVYYKKKFFANPPVERLMQLPAQIQTTPTEHIELYYFKDKHLLMLKADNNADLTERFLLHITPVDTADLPSKRKKYGFDNLDFTWSGGRNDGYYYHLVKMPNYPFTSFNIGQYNKTERIWIREIKLDSIK